MKTVKRLFPGDVSIGALEGSPHTLSAPALEKTLSCTTIARGLASSKAPLSLNSGALYARRWHPKKRPRGQSDAMKVRGCLVSQAFTGGGWLWPLARRPTDGYGTRDGSDLSLFEGDDYRNTVYFGMGHEGLMFGVTRTTNCSKSVARAGLR